GNLDQRNWEWYTAARDAKRPVWVRTYLFPDETGEPTYPGVTYASPLYRNGELIGVFGVDFDVFLLCRYLAGINVTENGYAFVVEQRGADSPQLIAHPREKVLLRKRTGPTGEQVSELTPLDDLKDRLVVDFLKNVPADKDLEKFPEAYVSFEHQGQTYRGIYRNLEREKGTTPRWLICIVLPEDDLLADA